MFRRGAIRWVVALALVAGLANPALAAPRAQRVEEGLRFGSLWEAVVGWLASGWTRMGWETAADGERGFSVDPNGVTGSSDGDRGLMIDPNGETNNSDGDRGAMIDPDG